MQTQTPAKEELPPYVRFSVMPVEDRTQLLTNGKYGFRNVEVAHVTRPGQRDTVVREAEAWLADLQKRSADGMVPANWFTHFSAMYEAWKKGLEMPMEGTPLRGWSLLLPAAVENLLLLGFQTVEQLAAADETAVQRIGVGGVRMRELARDWLASSDQGKAAAAQEALRVENAALRERVDTLARQIADLTARLPAPATV